MEENKELWERLAKVEESTKSSHKRMDSLDKLSQSVYVLANETKNMREEINNVIERVSQIEARPVKRYESIVAAMISAVVGIFVGYFL